MYRTRSHPRRRFGVFLAVLGIIGFGLYFGLQLETVRHKLVVISYYTETYIHKLRPKPALPAPPPASGVETDVLLQDYTAAGPAAASSSESHTTAPAYMEEVLDSVNGTGSQPGGVQLVESRSVGQISAIAPAVDLTGVQHEWQTWNNCGPSTVAMNLSYYADGGTQVEAARFLKPNQDDKNVSPRELVAYARSLGYQGFVGVGGTPELLQRFLSNGFPVIVEFWTEWEDAGGMGHYRLLTGYEAERNQFIAQDSLHGPDVPVPIDGFDTNWEVFNRTYLVVFPPEQAGMAQAIAGETAIEGTMYQQALATAQAAAQGDSANAFAWFNIGTNYARLGEVDLAAGAFDQARRLGLPYRMLWYQFDIYEVYLAQGRYRELIELATAVLEATGGLEELYYYRGLAYEALGQPEAAASDFQAAVDYNPSFEPAKANLSKYGVE